VELAGVKDKGELCLRLRLGKNCFTGRTPTAGRHSSFPLLTCNTLPGVLTPGAPGLTNLMFLRRMGDENSCGVRVAWLFCREGMESIDGSARRLLCLS